MPARAGIVVVLGAAALAGTPGDAYAQAPSSYGGGMLPTAAVPPPGYHPSVALALQPRGNRIALRFDTSVRCGRTSYDVTGRRTAAFDGVHVLAREGIVQLLGGGRRLLFSWTVSGTVSNPFASGTLRITGVLRRPGHRGVACARSPVRSWQARLLAPVTGAPATPAPGATLAGGSNQAIVDRLPGSILVRVTHDGRASALWTSVARCGRGSDQLLANYTPPRRIAPSATAASDEHFTIPFTDAVIRYHAELTAQFTTDGARGTLRLRANVFDRAGRRLRHRCDSGVRTWSAATAVPATAAGATGAPAPGGAGGVPGTSPPTPAPPVADRPQIQAGAFSFTMAGDPGDYISGGQTLTMTPPGSAMTALSYGPVGVSFSILDPNGTFWTADFAAGPGQVLRAGATYAGALRYPFNDGHPGLDISGDGRGCNELDGTFVVDAVAFDPNGALSTFAVRFEQHCEHLPAARRGTREFPAGLCAAPPSPPRPPPPRSGHRRRPPPRRRSARATSPAAARFPTRPHPAATARRSASRCAPRAATRGPLRHDGAVRSRVDRRPGAAHRHVR